MPSWDYQREEAPKLTGDQRLKIIEVEEKVSSKNNDMLVLTVSPNGSDIKIKHYIVKNEYFNRNMTQFFDSFNIDEGDFNLLTWPGATGAARLKEDENGYLKVQYFINKDKALKLPAWVGDVPERQTITDIMETFTDIADEDMPF